jgi:hypothetical protein
MKKIIISLACLLVCSGMQAQELNDLARQYKQQVGIDATALIDRIFSLSESPGFENPVYYLTYRKYGPRKNFRFGAGMDWDLERVAGTPFSDVNINLRFGAERYHDFAKRWRIFHGWDTKVNFSHRKSPNFVSTNTVALGAAPLIGFQFRINQRLSLATEATYNLFLFVSDDSDESTFGLVSSFQALDLIQMNFEF